MVNRFHIDLYYELMVGGSYACSSLSICALTKSFEKSGRQWITRTVRLTGIFPCLMIAVLLTGKWPGEPALKAGSRGTIKTIFLFREAPACDRAASQ